MTLCIAHPRFHPFDKLRRIVLEEIEIHGQGNAEQQFAIQRRLAEHLVKMVARAANLTRQPACAALVGFELRLDELPDVDVTVVFHCLLLLGALALFLRAMKMREFIALCRCRLWNARHTINNKIHAKSMNLCLLIPV